MGKLVKPLAIIAAVAVNVIPGVGQVLSAALVTAVTTAGISAALGYVGSALGLGPKSPKVTPATQDRLFANVDPATPRKIVFGRTAMATDIRYQEWQGTDQEYLHQIVCVASHKVSSIDEIWLDDELAWSAGAAVGKYAGYLTVTPRLEGTAANTVTIGTGSKWGSSRRMTGLAYAHMRFKVTGNSKKKESPFAQKIPSRMTIIGNGIPVYDPRFDSTQGGVGTMRAHDQATWAFTYNGVECGRNAAAQLLTYLLGWRITNPADSSKKLAVGSGIPFERFEMARWITAANACDESVLKVAGGSEPRYRTDGIFSEADDPRGVIEAFETASNSKLRDTGGRFGLDVLSNDLGTPRLALNDGDILSDFKWHPKGAIERTYNEIRGRWTDPGTVSLYQLVDYPRYREPPIDGIERVLTFDLPLVQSPSQAQRLVKQQFARLKYQGRFETVIGPRGWGLQLGDVVTLTFSALGWENKLFRVIEHGVRTGGDCPLVLQEENAAIYLWDRDERPAVQPVELVKYDASKAVLLQMLEAAELEYADGTSFEDLKPAEPGATAGGLTPSEAAQIAQLESDTAAAQAAIDAAEAEIALLISGGGSERLNPNPRLAWTDGDALPVHWQTWQTPTTRRLTDGSIDQPQYVGVHVAGGVQGGLFQTGFPIGAGYYVIDADVRLGGGGSTYQGAGLTLDGNLDASLHFATTADSNGVVSATAAGRRYFSKLVLLPSAAANWHLMAGWSGFGAISAKEIFVYKAGVRPATAEEIRSGTAIPPMQASISQQGSTLSNLTVSYANLENTVSSQSVTINEYQTAISTLQGGQTTLFGRAGVTVDVNGRVTGWETNNNGQFGNFKIHADFFAIEKPGGGERTEFSGGNWRVYDANGVLRVRWGVWA